MYNAHNFSDVEGKTKAERPNELRVSQHFPKCPKVCIFAEHSQFRAPNLFPASMGRICLKRFPCKCPSSLSAPRMNLQCTRQNPVIPNVNERKRFCATNFEVFSTNPAAAKCNTKLPNELFTFSFVVAKLGCQPRTQHAQKQPTEGEHCMPIIMCNSLCEWSIGSIMEEVLMDSCSIRKGVWTLEVFTTNRVMTRYHPCRNLRSEISTNWQKCGAKVGTSNRVLAWRDVTTTLACPTLGGDEHPMFGRHSVICGEGSVSLKREKKRVASEPALSDGGFMISPLCGICHSFWCYLLEVHIETIIPLCWTIIIFLWVSKKTPLLNVLLCETSLLDDVRSKIENHTSHHHSKTFPTARSYTEIACSRRDPAREPPVPRAFVDIFLRFSIWHPDQKTVSVHIPHHPKHLGRKYII